MPPAGPTSPTAPSRAPFSRAAVTHEWLTIPGGSEAVVLAMLEALDGLGVPADLYTTVYDPAPWPEAITGRRVTTTALDRIPGARRNYPKLLPLMPAAWRGVDLRGHDLVVSSNHACAKNVRTPAGALHVCYCHTPMRYAWDRSFFDGEDVGRATRALLPPLTAWLRRVDLRASAGVDQFLANSSFVAERIRRWYGREARVLHPPVDVAPHLARPRAPREEQDYYLCFGRLVPYKRVDLAIRACERLGRRLLIAGDGRDLERLRPLAGEHTEFLGRVSDERATDLLAGARALLFPGLEDFGIVPVEAQAAGCPVVAFGEGGVRDSVLDGRTGVLFPTQDVEGLVGGIERLEALDLDEAALRAHAEAFATPRFVERFAAIVEELATAAAAAQGSSPSGSASA